MRKKLTPRRLTAIVSGLLALISFARVAVLFLEALALVRDEREQDGELLKLCREGAARGSVKMRSACLAANADQASPLVLKAVVRAVSTAWEEFYTTVSTPFGALAVFAFFLMSLVMPVVPWAKALVAALGARDRYEHESDDDVESSHVVVVANGGADYLPRGLIRKRLSRARSFLRGSNSYGVPQIERGRSSPRIEFLPGEDEHNVTHLY